MAGRLFLLDGTAIAYRSHYAFARSGLAAPDGRPTGATYGFTMALRRILETEEPERVAVAFDARGPTFRHERYGDYKATRERAPEEMADQMPLVRRIVEAHGIPLYEIPGYEADDVIGTLASQAEQAGWEVMIVTADKDFMQLVSDKVRLYNIFKSDQQLVVEGLEAVEQKFGTTPDHVVDVLAIMGDSSDNVPGVKGIGEKGAVKLIEAFGSVDGLLAHLDELPAKTREKIERDRDDLLLSLELVRLDRAVPLDPPFAEMPAPAPDPRAILQAFQELDFRSLVESVRVQGAPAPEREDVLVQGAAGLAAMMAELRAERRFAFGVLADGAFPMRAELLGCSFAARPERAFWVPFRASPPVLPGGEKALLAALAPLLEDPALERVAQNDKFAAVALAARGLHLPPPAFDTMVAAFCVQGTDRRHDLDTLAMHCLGRQKTPLSELLGTGAKRRPMDAVPDEEARAFACEEAELTLRLAEVLEGELERAGAQALYHDLELPLVPVLTAMEVRGIRVDEAVLARISADVDRDAERAALDVQELAGRNFNVNSTKVLGEVLFEEQRIQDQAGVKRPKRTKTGWATDAPTLEEKYGDVPIVRRLLDYRVLSKLKGTYLDALPRYVHPATGRIHCSFSQVSAATGRLASSDPNLQNVPVRTPLGRRLREAFVAPPPDERGAWCLLSADYSQIELRVMAHFSGDESMIAAFEEGRDIHAATAARIFGVAPEAIDRGMRSRAKVINFGLLYGMGPQRVARETGMSVPEAREFIERYFGAFPNVREWIERTLAEARERGYVETLSGRRRSAVDLRSTNPRVRSFAENATVSTPIQGSAADIIKRAMIAIERRVAERGLAARMLLQVHDELVFEVPLGELEAARELVVDAMVTAWTLRVPLVAETGHGANWLEAH